jgi:hypothetical protein
MRAILFSTMKRIALIAIASALVIGGSAFGATAASSGAQAKPWLRLADSDPVTVRGANFKAGEQVTVTAATLHEGKTTRANKAARSSTRGSFTVTLLGLEIDDCGLRTTITAVGASGDRASVKFLPRPCGALR